MEPIAAVGEDEAVLRHVPGGSMWQAPPDDRISSINFRPRPGETGISVSRAVITSPSDLMARLGNPSKGSKIAAAAVADIRAIGLDVVPAPLDDDPGHAEIRPAAVGLDRKEIQRRLASVFRYITV